MKAIFNSLIMS